jgi:hypothetical protein
LVKNLLFLRLPRQDFVQDIDINNSQIVINSFLEEFQELYGTKNLSYNMYANLHLPKQVRKYGSFQFRFWFKKLKPKPKTGIFRFPIYGNVTVTLPKIKNCNSKIYLMSLIVQKTKIKIFFHYQNYRKQF